MPESTGPNTRKAGCIDRGWAKPDDPIYSEGWTITLGGLRGRLKTPSSDTPEVKPEVKPDDNKDEPR